MPCPLRVYIVDYRPAVHSIFPTGSFTAPVTLALKTNDQRLASGLSGELVPAGPDVDNCE